MKAINRKLLSLLLAMAMILTLAPTALASPGDGTSDNYVCTISGNATANVGQTVTLTASLTNNGTPVEGGVTYSWSLPSGMEATNNNTTSSSVTIQATGNPTQNVSGSVTCTATPSGGTGVTSNSTTVTFTYVAPSAPVADSVSFSGLTNGALNFSAGSTSSVNVTATVNPSPAGSNLDETGVEWTVPSNACIEVSGTNTNTITITPKAITGTTPQQVTITATAKAKGANNATVSNNFTVTVNPTEKQKPTLSLTTAPTTSANGIITVNMPAGVSYAGITWSVATAGILSMPSTTTPTNNNQYAVTGITAGTTSVSATLSGVNGGGYDNESVTTDSISVTVGSSVVATLSPSNTATPSNGTTVYLDNWSDYDNANYRTFTLTPSLTIGGAPVQYTSVSYAWTLNDYPVQNNNTVNANSYTLYSNNTYLKYGTNINTLKCVATFVYISGNQSVTTTAEYICYINTGYSNTLATASVSTSTSSYALGDVDDAGKSSIASQLDSYLYSTSSGRYGLAYVQFTGTTQNSTYGSLSAKTNVNYYSDRRTGTGYSYLSDVLFYPGSTKGTVSFPIRAYYYTSSSLTSTSTSYVDGVITFNVTEGVTTGDITYTASIGDDVSFVMGDFEDYYYTKTKGTLSYVSFTLPSGGSLYSDRGRLTTSNACYVSPTSSQADLAGVYFTPTGTTATRASTVRISFTAYGNRTSTSGTVAITYLAGSAKDITYNITTSGTLKASDFTDAYKAVVGSTAPSGLTIQFQSVPTYGTLTYKDSSRTSSSTVTLRSSNIKNYNFTTRTSGSNQLGDVTYTASGTRSDTIEYIAYVNSTPQFTGKVVFNSSNASASNMQIAKTSVSGAAVTFSYADFTTANAVVMASCSYIRVVTLPAGGTLTYNGTAVTLSSTNILPALLGSLVYRPSASFNNSTDRFSFLCYDANGNSVGGGQVSIVVTGNTSNSAGVTTVNQFKDVTATAWYRNDLITLVNAGIIQGRGDGKFDPTAELTYGEALKIFMLASGYPAQAEASGKDWAINYKNLAVSNGWISSSVDLSSKISRNQMAELAARSLGLSSSSASVPWTDGTANGYAVALYYTSPQILIGNADGTFKGTSTLLRQEICAIASRILTYRATQQSVDKPAWLG